MKRGRWRRRTVAAALGGAAAALLVVVATLAPVVPAGAALPPRYVRLAGAAAALPAGARVVGPTTPAAAVSAEVVLDPRDPAALASAAAAAATPGGPGYRHYLTRAQFADSFGPPATTVRATRAWLSDAGLSVGPTSPDGLLVPVSGSAADVERVFGLSLVDAQLPDGRAVRLARGAPLVPADLATSLNGVVGLSTPVAATPQDRRPASAAVAGPVPAAPAGPAAPRVASAASAAGGPVPCTAVQDSPAVEDGGYTADQLAATYGFSGLYGEGLDGSGQTIGVFELESLTGPMTRAIGTFATCYGLTNPFPAAVDVDGGGGTTSDEGVEGTLDVEEAMALAPGATVDYFDGPDTTQGIIDTYDRMVTDASIDVISTSWGVCEPDLALVPGLQSAESTLFEEAAVVGQTVVAAAGDSGSSDCYDPGVSYDSELAVDDPADQPTVTGVGGTTLETAGTTPTETVWNDGGGAGGGGVSTDFTRPAWQVGPGAGGAVASAACAATGQSSCREVPDVAASADEHRGLALYLSGIGWQVVGGTSAATPLWAALIADVDQGLSAPVGMLAPTLAAAARCPSAPFNDVTEGNNALFASSQGRYPAGPGDDLASGWGSPRAVALAAALAEPPACPYVTSVTPADGAEAGGSSVTVRGVDLGGAVAVRFGTVPARSFSVTSGSSLSVVVPSGPPGGGTVDVTVTGPGGTSLVVSDDHYTYARPGYWADASDGGVFAYGAASFHGSAGATHLNAPVVGMAPTPDGQGYWLVASDGGIFAYGDAVFYGSAGGRPLNRPVVGMASTPDGQGYWLVASDGGVFSYGDAGFLGSMGAHHLNAPIVGMAPTPDGQGYWLVASDGGVFSYGDAGFLGSMGGHHLNAPIVGMAPTPDGQGYWLVASDGGVFSYGDAGFLGSMGGHHLNAPIVGMAPTPDGQGYWLVASDGGVFSYGDAGFLGSAGGSPPAAPVVGMAAT